MHIVAVWCYKQLSHQTLPSQSCLFILLSLSFLFKQVCTFSKYFFGAATESFLSIYIISVFGLNREGNSNSTISTYFALPHTKRCSINFLQFLEHQQKIFQCSSSVKPSKRKMMKSLWVFFLLKIFDPAKCQRSFTKLADSLQCLSKKLAWTF